MTTFTRNMPTFTRNMSIDHQEAPVLETPVHQLKLPRLLCWVMMDPNLMERVTHVKETWASHCDICLFMSSHQNDSFPTIGLNVTEGRSHIGAKSKAAWTYVYKHHFNDAEYFVKTDPDTFLVVENLKQYMARRDPDVPEFFGHRLYEGINPGNPKSFGMGKGRVNVLYNSGGPGQLLSRRALQLLVATAYADKSYDCMPDGTGEWLAKNGHVKSFVKDEQGESFVKDEQG